MVATVAVSPAPSAPYSDTATAGTDPGCYISDLQCALTLEIIDFMD